MVEVGVLAGLINAVLLLFLMLAGRSVSRIVHSFASSRLRYRLPAPVIHDIDTWIPNIPFTIVRLRRYPYICLTISCFGLLLVAEIFADIGVYESRQCRPERKEGVVIRDGQLSPNSTSVERTASAFYLQNVQFVDGELTSVPSSFPRSISSSTCIPCLAQRNRTSPPIAADCTVRAGLNYAAGDMRVSVWANEDGYDTLTTAFEDVTVKPSKQYKERGAITRYRSHCTMFTMYSDMKDKDANASDITFRYFEYSNNSHCEQLWKTAMSTNVTNQDTELVTQVTQGVVRSYSIHCTQNQLSVQNFTLAMQVYRTMQLESPDDPEKFNNDESQFPAIRASDVYRAILAIKVIDDKGMNGSFFEYRRCGKFNGLHAIPFGICILSLALLGTVAFVKSKRALVHFPYSARGWSRQLAAASHDTGPVGYVGTRGYMGECDSQSSSWWRQRPLDEVIISWDTEFQMARLKYVDRGTQ